jgi:type III secretory pathway component EscR
LNRNDESSDSDEDFCSREKIPENDEFIQKSTQKENENDEDDQISESDDLLVQLHLILIFQLSKCHFSEENSSFYPHQEIFINSPPLVIR